MKLRVGLFALLVSLAASSARAESIASYALVVGNNAPPTTEGSALPVLQFADDDAIRYYQFFSRLSARIHLLTVPDRQTQKRYPKISGVAELPSQANLLRIVEEFAASMEQDRKEGRQPVFYLVYSGHGAIDEQGDAFLALLDGGITHELLYEQVLNKLPAAYSHLLIDACRAGAVVGVRGMFDRESDAAQVPISVDEARQVVGSADSSRFPGLGVIVATTADQEAHEWSRIESGVFSHQLLSGFQGPADVNGDGVIEYSEIHAFVASANRAIKDPRAIPRVIARPPPRNRNAALFALSSLDRAVIIEGDPSKLGHFHIELENGQRYLDANLGDMSRTRIAVPAQRLAFLRTDRREARLAPRRSGTVRISDLEFDEREVEARGSIDQAYRTALFASAFGKTYYQGFVDSIGAVAVAFPEIPPAEEADPGASDSWRRPMSITSLCLAGASAVAFAVTGGLALDARRDFQATNLQRQAHEANQRYSQMGNAALATGIVAAAAGVATWLLWPDSEDETAPIAVDAWLSESAGVAVKIRW